MPYSSVGINVIPHVQEAELFWTMHESFMPFMTITITQYTKLYNTDLTFTINIIRK